MFAFNATCVSDRITSLMKQIPAINAHLPSLLCTRAPRRRRAMGGSLPRRQRQSPPPKEPRKRRQRAPSWGTAPLANSLGTRSVRSSGRSRTLRNHRGLLAEREEFFPNIWPDVQSSGNPCGSISVPGGMETILSCRVPLVGPSVSSGFWSSSCDHSCPVTNTD